MAKFYGPIGYALPEEASPGVWTDVIVEKNYRGDIVLDQRRWQSPNNLNDDLNVDNSVSIIGDNYAYQNLGTMKYIILNGIAWGIKSFSINRPRIILQIGRVYNGERPIITP